LRISRSLPLIALALAPRGGRIDAQDARRVLERRRASADAQDVLALDRIERAVGAERRGARRLAGDALRETELVQKASCPNRRHRAKSEGRAAAAPGRQEGRRRSPALSPST